MTEQETLYRIIALARLQGWKHGQKPTTTMGVADEERHLFVDLWLENPNGEIRRKRQMVELAEIEQAIEQLWVEQFSYPSPTLFKDWYFIMPALEQLDKQGLDYSLQKSKNMASSDPTAIIYWCEIGFKQSYASSEISLLDAVFIALSNYALGVPQ